MNVAKKLLSGINDFITKVSGREGPTQGPRILNLKNIYILPSSAGIGFSFVIFSILIGSINYISSLGYVLTFFLVGIFIVTILHSFKNLTDLKIAVGNAPNVFVDELTYFPVFIEEMSHSQRYSVWVKTLAGFRCCIDIDENETASVLLPARTDKRGLVPCSQFTLTSYFPLGLFRPWSPINIYATTTVYPKPMSAGPLPVNSTNGLSQESAEGMHKDDFFGLRSYQAGDSLKSIHWNSIAKGREPVTRQFSGENSAEEIMLNGDVFNSSIEDSLSKLTQWVLDADRLKYKYGLCFKSIVIEIGAGVEHRSRCLEALALYKEL
jgi:uncharacterized protein (DUF58 family)